jgi:hypothetical protein
MSTTTSHRFRKTASVEALKTDINRRIAHEPEREARRALCYLLSDILSRANWYRGFRYLDGWHGVEDYRHEYY